MIPKFTFSGVLPPYAGADPTQRGATSPYLVSLEEVAVELGTTPERREILRGLLQYRAALRSIGIVNGVQWLDGSFVEDVETTRGRPPSDIDIVTFAPRVGRDINDWIAIFSANPTLFDPMAAKSTYKVDAYFVDLAIPPYNIVQHTTYWYGLFSHQKSTRTWKGLLQVLLNVNDDPARGILDSLDAAI